MRTLPAELPDDPTTEQVEAWVEPAGTIDTFSDRRVERYGALLGILNGWDPWPPRVPVFEWSAAAPARPPGGLTRLRSGR